MSLSAVKSYMNNHKIRNGMPRGMQAGAATKLYPKEVRQYISDHYSGTGPKAMTDKLNERFGTSYTVSQIKAYYHNYHINSGLTGHFEKGCVPVNKGRKGMRVHPNSAATQFRKGNVPVNTYHIGTLIERQDGYLYRKTGPGRFDWRQEHILVWEAVNGPLPEGCMLTFLDGNRKNISLDNLRVIDKKTNLELNRKRLRSSDPELNDTAITLAELMTKTRAAKKGTRNGR